MVSLWQRIKPKSKRKKEGAAASSVEPATSSKNITGTSITDRDVSQSAQTSPKQVTLSIAQSASSVQQPATAVSAVPPTTAPLTLASRTQTTSYDTVASSPNLSKHLWDQAYDGLKADEPTLVDAYEKILSRELKEDDSNITASEPNGNAIKTDPETRRSQMSQLVQAGIKKTERQARVKQGIGEVMQVVLSFKDIIDLAVQAAPQAALAWTGVCFALQILLNPTSETKANREGIAHVIQRMDWYWNLSGLLLKENTVDGSAAGLRDELQKRIVDLYKALLLYQIRSVCSYCRNQGVAFLRDIVKLDDWDGNLKTVQDAEAAVRQDSDVYDKQQIRSHLEQETKLLQDQISMQLEEKDQQCVRDLCLIDPKDEIKDIEARKDPLLEDSYRWILNCKDYIDFTNWKDNKNHRLLWIKGDAGKGKTMLLIGIIRELSKRLESNSNSPHLSYFFCQGTNSDLNTATAILRCLVWMMLVQQPFLIPHLRKKYDPVGPKLFEDNKFAVHALSEAFDNMLEDTRLSRVYLIVDALDECVDAPGLVQLLRLISATIATSRKVKWLVSSRYRPDIESQLRDREGCARLELELNPQCISNAVDIYIDHKLSVLDQEKQYGEELREHIAEELRKKANGTFLWVALVCNALKSAESYDAVDVLHEIPSGLKELYDGMMGRIRQLDRKDPELCKRVLATMTLAYRPLHLSELEILAGIPNKVPLRSVIKKCASFLTIREDIVYPVHQSANDYLSTHAEPEIFPQGCARGHGMIVSQSLHAMSNTLERDVYDLQDPGFLIEQVNPINPDPLARVRYACVYWIAHLCEINTSLYNQIGLCDNGAIDLFLKKHFLHWLEALSLMRSMSSGVVVIRKLENLLAQNPNNLWDFLSMIQDANRFILHNRYIIERAPLQVYASALIFSPTMSRIRKLFQDEEPSWIEIGPKVDDNWSPCLQTLVGHTSSVSSVTFSHDGRRLASASHDKTVRIWDAETGALQQTLVGHTGPVYSVAFSHDGRRLASASSDETVRIWDAETGALQQTLVGHTGSVSSVTFSHDGRRLASASHDETVRIWDAKAGALQQTLTVSTSSTKLSFSHDGSILNTTRGSFNIQNLSWLSYSLREDQSWVSWDENNILWLPPGYRSHLSMVEGQTIVILYLGRILIIKSKEGVNPLNR